MSDLTIRAVDTDAPDQLRAWWEVGAAASAERPYPAWPSWEVSRTALPVDRADVNLRLFAAWRDDAVVGAGLLVLALLDNTQLGELSVYVAPERRCSGIGAALLSHGEGIARAAGRTTVIGSVFAPLDEPSPGTRFAHAHGYRVASEEETKVLHLDEAMPTWDELRRRAALGDHRVEVFEGPVPEDLVASYATALDGALAEIPTGLDLETGGWTPQRIREAEARDAATDRVRVVALALTPERTVCGFSDVRINRADPGHGSVGLTLVLPGHRGRGLGLAMKLANHDRLKMLFPQCTWVETENAGVNAPMNRINEAMGYRVVERCLDLDKEL